MRAEELREALGALARNHRWTWDAAHRAVLAELPGASPEVHPARTVAALTPAELEALAADGERCARVAGQVAALAAERVGRAEPTIAYLSPEFGISELVPQYSGGLGILAGDHLKAASDLGLPLVGVGLFYDHGYFRQRVGDGQDEHYERLHPADLGYVDTGVSVPVELGEETVIAEVLRFEVGRVDLLALWAPGVTDRLYGGDRRHRLHQELVLGVGGVRALHALGIRPDRYHLNEGHAGFALLERLAAHRDAGAGVEEAVGLVRAETVFTTHTPVPAGIERFDRDLLLPYLAPWADRLELPLVELLELGTSPDDGPARPFNLAVWCLQLAGLANGVSQLHGEVSRELFSATPAAKRIGHVTNGVHARTWVHEPVQHLFDEALGAGWSDGDPAAWGEVEHIPTAAVAPIRRAARAALSARLAARTGVTLDPDACTIGFARRFSTYKRAALLLAERERLAALLADDDRPVQFVFAGKAHPADEPGKAVLASVLAFARSPEARGRFHFLPDYEMGVARTMYAACDVWLNNPVRPQEACGTSGMKSALNGGLNCSILDGWWDEWYDPAHGWAIPTSHAEDAGVRDREESVAMHDLLAGEIVPLFHAGGGGGGEPWWDRVRTGWSDLGPKVTASRMLRDYRATYYA